MILIVAIHDTSPATVPSYDTPIANVAGYGPLNWRRLVSLTVIGVLNSAHSQYRARLQLP